MKLSEFFNQQYVIVVTKYGSQEVDTTRNTEDYDIKQSQTTTLAELGKDDDTVHIAGMIRALGAEGAEEELIKTYEGTVAAESGMEDCTIYAPTFWQ